MFVFLKAVEQEVLFKLRERQDAQPVELGMVEMPPMAGKEERRSDVSSMASKNASAASGLSWAI
jgi:hypothetical protein